MVEGALARGCRPQMASFAFRASDNDAATEKLILAFFNSLAGSDFLQRISFGWHTPLTMEVFQAAASAAPFLSSLEINNGNEVVTGMQQHPPGPAAAAAAVRLLLQLVGPRLRVLELYNLILPAWALEPLAQCTALTELRLRNHWHAKGPNAAEEELSVLRTLSSLASLRKLSLVLNSNLPLDPACRHLRAAGLESCLSSLTALSSLDILLGCQERPSQLYLPMSPMYRGLGVEEDMSRLASEGLFVQAAQLLSGVTAEWRALAGAARCMPRLASLRAPTARAEAADLASLTALTSLEVGAITAPTPAAAAAPHGAAEDNQPAPALVYDLPPSLKQLAVHAPVAVHVAAALGRSPAPVAGAGGPKISWKAAEGLVEFGTRPFWALEFRDGDVDAETRLTAEAVAAVRRAVRNLKGSFSLEPGHSTYRLGQSGPYLQVFGIGTEAVRPPAAAAHQPGGGDGGGGAGSHCGSWLGGLLAELRPDSLKLRKFAFSPRDMLGMVRCMGTLKVLHLHECSYNLSALPLLGRLPAVEKLTLCCTDWEWPLEVDLAHMIAVLQAAFLGLTAPVSRRYGDWESEHADADGMYACKATLPLPQLKQLTVFFRAAWQEVWLREGLEPVAAELERRVPYPVTLEICDC